MSNNYFDSNTRRRARGGQKGYFHKNKRSVLGSGRGSVRGSVRDSSPRRKIPVPLLIIIDVLLAALLLIIFYVTNYEMQGETGPIASLPVPSSFTSSTHAVTTPEVTVSPSSEVTETPMSIIDPNDWRAKFTGKFTDGEVEITENSYKNANIDISIEKVEKDGSVYFIAEIYVAELKYFMSAFAKKSNVMGYRELTDKVARDNNAILAITGDHCVDNEGTVVRNGQLFRETKSSLDVLIMNYDGSMQTFLPDEFDVERILEEGVYQVWTFGPSLLRDGQPMTQFNTTLKIGGENPRAAVGYYEPGHYCFVLVDGRQPGYSTGMRISELSQLFSDIGCKLAYNMDGGRSAEMVFMGELVNQPMDGRRSTTDIIFIGE